MAVLNVVVADRFCHNSSSDGKNVLPNADYKQIAEIEREFLKNNEFREYTDNLDLNFTPTVVYSRVLR